MLSKRILSQKTSNRKKRLPLALGLLLGLGSLPATLFANPYETYIDIDTEEDLYDLRSDGVIDEDTFETLVELLQRGVDLNTANRNALYALPNLSFAEVDAILAYRDEVGRIRDPAVLVSQGLLRSDKLNAIAAFLVVRSGENNRLSTSGQVKVQTRYSVEDSGMPASAIQLRAQGLGHLTLGLAATASRLEIGKVRYDPARDALSAKAAQASAHLPKLYVEWKKNKYSVIAGTYRTGFGQRLTFDTTDHSDPDGFYGDREVFRGAELVRECKLSTGELASSLCPASQGYTYVSPDYKTRDGLLGLAASLREIKLGKGLLQAHLFTSYQPRSIYQYELYDTKHCEDPRSEDSDCSAPDVYRTADAPLELSPKYSFQTLPKVYAETILGGNLSYALSRRTHLGITGYGAQVDWLVEGIDLDFQEWSRLPFGGSFGALGVDGSIGYGKTDFLAEVTKSFDGMPSGGGIGALLRAVTAWKKNEIESSLRYYDKGFKNPHARPIAAADEFEGARARDEIGARIKFSGELDKRFRLRSTLDYWQSPTLSTKEIMAYVRGDLKINDRVMAGLWLKFQDKDLARKGRNECYTGTENEIGPNGPLQCAGQLLQGTTRVRVTPHKIVSFDLQYQHKLLDDSKFDSQYRQDMAFVASATIKPNKDFRLRARTRYLFEATSDTAYGKKNSWTYAELSYRFRKKDKLKFRYDLLIHLDDRDSTRNRIPNPEHWARLEYEAFF